MFDCLSCDRSNQFTGQTPQEKLASRDRLIKMNTVAFLVTTLILSINLVQALSTPGVMNYFTVAGESVVLILTLKETIIQEVLRYLEVKDLGFVEDDSHRYTLKNFRDEIITSFQNSKQTIQDLCGGEKKLSEIFFKKTPPSDDPT